MTTTTNLNLKKPEYSDDADISDINDNMETIDAAIGALPIGKTVQGQIDEKVSKVTGATNGNIAILDGNGDVLDSGKNFDDVHLTVSLIEGTKYRINM